MGNHDVGRAFAAAADVFWIMSPPGGPSKATTLAALEAVGEHFYSADAEFDDELFDQTTNLGRMVAIAFDAEPHELVESNDDGEPWAEGPVTRFREHFNFK